MAWLGPLTNIHTILGYLANKIEAARAHCDSIDYTYDEILKPWFSFSDLDEGGLSNTNLFRYQD
jgi:hypothetical protein